MADYGTLFQLILVALTFVIIGMFFIVYLMVLGVREKARLEGKETSEKADTKPSCPHFLGYLAERPKNQPIPDECCGCVQTTECMSGQAETEAVVEEPEPFSQ